MKNISKSFPGVKALEDVEFNLNKGEVIGLVGENGAGKTTLMNILNGVFPPDNGKIFLDNQEISFKNPYEAQEAGIAYIHQELNLINELSVKENLFLGREYKTPWKTINFKKMYNKSMDILKTLDIDINPDEFVGNLPLAVKQMVEIARALMFEARIIVMDEPTSSLTDEEIDILFKLIKQLKTEGKGIIYISHRIDEIFAITDRVTVLRNGKLVGSKKTNNVDYNTLVKMMAGTEVQKRFFKEKTSMGEEILKVENIKGKNQLQNISFNLLRGEIVGIAGLMGSGRTELLETLFGITPPTAGNITYKNKKFFPHSSTHTIREGIAYIPEDREMKGLFLDFSLIKNIYLTKSEKEEMITDENQVLKPINKLIEKLNIITPSARTKVKNLSGGNRQKTILARWMLTGMNLLLVNEPTRGIDVNTKTEIYKLLYELNKKGVAIIVVSSELPELLTISDRILVMYEGKINKAYHREDANKENLLKAMYTYEPGEEMGCVYA